MSVKQFLPCIEPKNRRSNVLVGYLCLGLVGMLDWIVPDYYYTGFLYIFPIAFTAWCTGKRYVYGIPVCAAILFTICNHPHLSWAQVWNSASTFGIFLVIGMLVSRNREMLEAECALSRNDHLTGLLNSRAFREKLDYEINRFKRDGEPFSVGYIDLDRFKEVNDRYGHKRGDELLKLAADLFRSNVRKTDMVARMGGDEFAIFLPATNHEAVKVVMHKLWKEFLNAMNEKQWTTTFSMGVVTFEKPPANVDEVIDWADNLMYKVKLNGKNMIEFAMFTGGA